MNHENAKERKRESRRRTWRECLDEKSSTARYFAILPFRIFAIPRDTMTKKAGGGAKRGKFRNQRRESRCRLMPLPTPDPEK
jgi:hypothetical protein